MKFNKVPVETVKLAKNFNWEGYPKDDLSVDWKIRYQKVDREKFILEGTEDIAFLLKNNHPEKDEMIIQGQKRRLKGLSLKKVSDFVNKVTAPPSFLKFKESGELDIESSLTPDDMRTFSEITCTNFLYDNDKPYEWIEKVKEFLPEQGERVDYFYGSLNFSQEIGEWNMKVNETIYVLSLLFFFKLNE